VADGLAIAVTSGPGHVVMHVAGECDATTQEQFQTALRQVTAQEPQLVILDLAGLTFLDSSGVHLLLDTRSALVATGGLLTLACVQPIVARMLTLVGIDRLIRIAGTVEEAARRP
jgi:anti-sigma B factor antagonist